jgi:hypothetical protein
MQAGARRAARLPENCRVACADAAARYLGVGSLDEGTPDVVEGMVLFAAAGLAAAAFAALTCRWHSDPIATMTIVSVVSLITLASYYVFLYGLSD